MAATIAGTPTASLSAAVDRPTGYGTDWGDGDLVLIYEGWYTEAGGSEGTITNFTKIRAISGTGDHGVSGTWWAKEAGASEPATYSNANAYTLHAVAVVGGVMPTATDDHSVGNSGTGTNPVGSAVTSGTADALLLLGLTGYDVGASAVAGMDEVASIQDVNTAWSEAVGSGSTGTRTATASTSQWASVMLVIDAEGGGGGGAAPAPQSGLAFTGGMGGGLRKPLAPSRRETTGRVYVDMCARVDGYGQFRRSESGLFVPKRLAA